MASIFDRLANFGDNLLDAPKTFFEAGYAATPQGQLEKQKRELAQQNSILAQITNNPNLSQQQKLEALSQASPEFMQKRLELMLQPPKPLNAPNVQFNPATEEMVISQYDPNTGQLMINTPQGMQGGGQMQQGYGMQQQPVMPNMPQEGGEVPTAPTGLTPRARREFDTTVAKGQADRALAKPKVLKSFMDTTASLQSTLKALDDVSKQTGYGKTGLSGALMGNVAGSDAYNLRQGSNLVIQSRNFVNGLQSMRDNSPTGGAVGNVTEREGDKIQSMIAAINPNLGENEYLKQVNNLRQELIASHERIRGAVKQEYGVKLPELKLDTQQEGAPSDLSKMSDAQLMQLLQSLPE